MTEVEMQFAKTAYQGGFIDGYMKGLDKPDMHLTQAQLEKAWEASATKRIYERGKPVSPPDEVK